MKTLVLISLFSFALAGRLPSDFDDHSDLSLEEFEEFFGHEYIVDPEEKAKRELALKSNEDIVKKANDAFAKGEQTWYDEIYEFSDLPEDEFVAQHTGLIFRNSSLMREDAASERFFSQESLNRATVPAAYDAIKAGLVTPVRNQGNCGSCVAFATAAVVETCFAKHLGGASKTGDYSEQQMVDCGFGLYDANGCGGAALESYVRWMKMKKPKLAGEKSYPYKAKKGTCPNNYKTLFQGVSVNDGYWTTKGSEELLKKMVAKYGAVITGVVAKGPFSAYRGGIFQGCTDHVFTDHAVVVVGYGTENGVDYWTIKNSWGTSWGEKGYVRVKRGVKMCGVGNEIVHVKCGKQGGTTSATSATTSASAATTTAATPATTTPGGGDYPGPDYYDEYYG